MPDLIAADNSKLFHLQFDSKESVWNLAKTKPFAEIEKIIPFNEKYLIKTANEIHLLGKTFRRIKKLSFSNLSYIETSGNNVFVGADGCLIRYNKNLKETGRLELIDPEKGFDHILIYGKTAYLVDDTINPLYIFRIDISNRRKLQLIDAYVFPGANAHLSHQFIYPEFDQWNVIEKFGHQGGTGEVIHVFSMTGLKPDTYIYDKEKLTTTIVKKTTIPVFGWSEYGKKVDGFRVIDILPEPPHWCIIQDVHYNYFLAKLDTRNETDNLAVEHQISPLENRVNTKDEEYRHIPENYKIVRANEMILVCKLNSQKSEDYFPIYQYNTATQKTKRLDDINLVQFGITQLNDFIIKTQ